MKAVVFDIETVGCDFNRLDCMSQEYFLKFAEQEDIQRVSDSMNFYPLTAQIVAIGMMDGQSREGAVYFQDEGSGIRKYKDGPFCFYAGDERWILENFWRQLRRYDVFVTFNGRMFDCPFVMIRSAVHMLRVERNLVPYRYSADQHVDLADQLSFYGCMSRRFPLHMWCRAFGIPSPKESGVSGLDVKELFLRQRYREIAGYCSHDVVATGQLYDRWKAAFAS